MLGTIYDCFSRNLFTDNQAGAVLEGFLRFPETTQDFPSTMSAPLFGYNISRGIHRGLNSGFNWPFFQRKWGDGLFFFFFFGRHEGKLETFAKNCAVASLETLREDPTVRIRDKQAAWKLLSKISRTAPDISGLFLRGVNFSSFLNKPAPQEIYSDSFL